MNEDRVLYLCDPSKRAAQGCPQTGCAFRGAGECMSTAYRSCAQTRPDGEPIVSYRDDIPVDDTCADGRNGTDGRPIDLTVYAVPQ